MSIGESLDPPVLVSGVLPGSAADAQGVKVGDELVSVDGDSLATMDPNARAFRLLSQRAGEKINVVVQSGEGERTLELETSDALYRQATGG